CTGHSTSEPALRIPRDEGSGRSRTLTELVGNFDAEHKDAGRLVRRELLGHRDDLVGADGGPVELARQDGDLGRAALIARDAKCAAAAEDRLHHVAALVDPVDSTRIGSDAEWRRLAACELGWHRRGRGNV